MYRYIEGGEEREVERGTEKERGERRLCVSKCEMGNCS